MDVRMSSLILAPIRTGRYERQFRGSLPSDRCRDLRAESRGISTERTERLGHCAIRWYDNVHQQVPAVRCRRNVLDEHIVQAVVGVSISQREIQRALYLSAELPRLPLGLSARRQTVGYTSPQSLGKFWLNEICCPFRATISVFQDKAPLLRKHAHPART
jgi:hypothetical protein